MEFFRNNGVICSLFRKAALPDIETHIQWGYFKNGNVCGYSYSFYQKNTTRYAYKLGKNLEKNGKTYDS